MEVGCSLQTQDVSEKLEAQEGGNQDETHECPVEDSGSGRAEGSGSCDRNLEAAAAIAARKWISDYRSTGAKRNFYQERTMLLFVQSRHGLLVQPSTSHNTLSLAHWNCCHELEWCWRS